LEENSKQDEILEKKSVKYDVLKISLQVSFRRLVGALLAINIREEFGLGKER